MDKEYRKIGKRDWDKLKKSLTAKMSPDQAAAMSMVMDNSRAAMTRRDWLWLKEIKSRMKYLVGVETITPFGKVLLPIIRRVMPQVIAQDIVNVQPMTAPVAQSTTLRYKYGRRDDMNIHERWRHEIYRVLYPIIRRVKLLWAIRYSKRAIFRQYKVLVKEYI